MLLDAADAYCLAGEVQGALVAVRQAAHSAGHARDPIPAVFAAQHAAVLALCGRLCEARAIFGGSSDELEKAALESDLPVGWRRILRLGLPALLARLGELETACRILDEAVSQSRAMEALGLLPRMLVLRAELSLRTGDWDGARAGAAEAVRLAERGGQVSDQGPALVCLARLAAARGQREECAGYLEQAREIMRRGRLGGLAVPINAVEGLLELSCGEHEAAFVRLERVVRQVEAGSAADPGWVGWVPDFVEAAVHVGRDEEAQRIVTELRPQATASVVLPAIVARCDGLLTPERGEECFRAALQPAAGTGEPFEQARTELCFGEWLGTHGQPAEAGLRLRSAAVVFAELGAGPWARRAARALDTLEPPDARRGRPVEVAPGDARLAVLTGQERRVALLVGQGATNREAADALFVTTKTIEFHLRGVYRKLGVRSRSELAHIVGQALRPVT
jgi:DNA-binding CsgD family transcriptional regulator